MNLTAAAERLAAEWGYRNHTPVWSREQSAAEYVLRQLADPESDYGLLLDELCRRRWTAEQVRAS
jgi:hypothetical protein